MSFIIFYTFYSYLFNNVAFYILTTNNVVNTIPIIAPNNTVILPNCVFGNISPKPTLFNIIYNFL